MSKNRQGSAQGNNGTGNRRQFSDNQKRHHAPKDHSSNGHGDNSNSWGNRTPKPVPEDDDVARALNDRLLFLLAKSIGSYAIVTVASGCQYRGIFSAADTSKDLGVVLSQAEKHAGAPGEDKGSEEFYDQLIINSKEFMDIYLESPDLNPDKQSGFRTDADISGKLELKERELQKWAPEASDDPLAGALEDDSRSGRGNWDQFAVNERKFGLQSTYDENYYTTAIDKNHPEYIKREKDAEILAAEINNSSYGGNVHMAEERGLVDDSGLDEEDKYSGVDRRSASEREVKKASADNGGVKAYTPPQFRAPSGVKPTSSAVPYDPAIISSSLATPDGSLLPKSTASQESKPSESHAGGNIENEVFGNFKQFVSVEVERVNQKKQLLQKKEKSERLHDFKKFSEDYKIHAPVPPDLIPLLAKGKERQEEILQRSASAAASPVSTKSKISSTASSPAKNVTEPVSGNKVAPTTPQPAVAAAAAAAAAAEKPKPKFNFRAAGFKPNAGAPAFTPTFNKSSPVPSAPANLKSPSIPHSSNSGSNFKQSPSRQPSATVNSANGFFGGKTIKPKLWKGKFNPIIEAKKKHEEEGEGEFYIDRAYTTPPTWYSTIDATYGEVFASKHSGFFNGARTGFPHSPAALNAQLASMMHPGLVFDDRGNPIMSTSPPPIMAGMVPGYGQYGQYNPQYFGRGAPQQFNQQQLFAMGYVPPAAAAMAAAMAVANGAPYGSPGGQHMMAPPQGGRLYSPKQSHSRSTKLSSPQETSPSPSSEGKS